MRKYSNGNCSHLSPRAGRGRIALAIRVRGRIHKGGRDRLKNARYVTEHIIIPESQYSVIVIKKPFVARNIARAFRVLTSIHFDDEAAFTGHQIDNVRTDRLLSNKLVAIETSGPQAMPQHSLGIGGVAAQAPGTFGPDLISFSHVEMPPHPDCLAIRPLPARGERLASRMIQ